MKWWIFAFRCFLLFFFNTLTTGNIIQNDPSLATCGRSIHLQQNQNLTLDIKSLTLSRTGTSIIAGHIRCVLEIRSNPDTLLQLNLRYNYDTKVKGCNHGYIHVGNDGLRLGEESMTSYKFCDSMWDSEIVSRDNYMWIVYDYNAKVIPNVVEIRVHSLVSVPCQNSSYFPCSPVQCISKDFLCDGKIDCNNRRDEYCAGESVEEVFTETDKTCFLCDDGNCINPEPTLYALDHDKPLSYICDGFKHCKDGSDERKDMCYRTKSKVSEMLSCPPVNRKFHYYPNVLMWQDKICDGQQDCENNQDEGDCNRSSSISKAPAIAVNQGALVIILCASGLLLVWIIFFAYRTGNRCRGSSRNQSHDQITSRSSMIRSRDLQDPMEACRLQTVSEEPENSKWA